MYNVTLEMENGDNFSAYSPSDELFSKLDVNKEIEYVLVKTDGKTKVKDLSIVRKKKMKPLISNLDGIDISSLLFIDIETVRVVDKLPKAGTPLYQSWQYKKRKDNQTAAELRRSYEDEAPLYSEFGKVVTISLGLVKPGGVSINSFYGDDEKLVLEEFLSVLEVLVKRIPNLKLCGHSIVGFDVPYLIRRLIINGIRVPEFLNYINQKPWNLTDMCIDIADWWKNTGFYGASLINMAVAFGLPSPKQDIDGSKVGDVYYKEKGGLVKITKYCEQDVFCVIQIMQHLFNIPVSTEFISKTFDNEQK